MKINGFEWDSANIEHITRHGVEWEEAEEVLKSSPWFRRARDGRYLAVGQTETGRYLVIVFEFNPGTKARVVTARPANENERKTCRKEKK